MSHTKAAPQRASMRLLLASPWHWMALGLGSGLAPVAPGTVGTLWAWLSWALLAPWVGPWLASGALAWGITAVWLPGLVLLAAGTLAGVWACGTTAQALGTGDPGAVVWDEIIAFWAVLWVLGPVGWAWQVAAFALFRAFDAAKPGPVGWADRAFHGTPPEQRWRNGLGIMLDDAVAALATLLTLALLVRLL